MFTWIALIRLLNIKLCKIIFNNSDGAVDRASAPGAVPVDPALIPSRVKPLT